jgi:polysaccharide export outer membrane protein
VRIPGFLKRRYLEIPAPSSPGKHLIAPGDILIFYGLDVCAGPRTTPANGKIVILLVGEIQVAGRTSDQVAHAIKEPLSKFLNNPLVRIKVEGGRKYDVDGEVNHQGAYCLEMPTTVLEALNISGGLNKHANPK